MKYTLLIIFLNSGDTYVLGRDLAIQTCAGQAAVERSLFLSVREDLNPRVGEVRFECKPQPINGPHSG